MSKPNIVSLFYQGQAVNFTGDGWFNATEASQRYGKRPADWLSLDGTQEYIAALCAELRSEKSQLLKVKRGGRGRSDSTWFHPKLAVPFARWLDVRFAVWADIQIDNLIRGRIDRRKLRGAAASSYKVMAEILLLSRRDQGKETASHHYSNEARLVNWALTGEFKSIDRDDLSASDLDLLASLEDRNSVLIGRGLEYADRKKLLEQHALDWKASHVAPLPAGSSTPASEAAA